jgi:hypothetical protein
MKKLFILSLCFMFFVQSVEAHVDLFCGHCCEHKRKCLAKKSAVKEKYKNETKQHNNCQEQYSNCQEQYSSCQNQHSNCQVERDSYKTWFDRLAIFTGSLVFAAVVVVGYQCSQNKELKRQNARLRRHSDPYRTVHG